MVKKRCGRGFEFYSHILNMADSFNGFLIQLKASIKFPFIPVLDGNLTEMKGGKKI